MPVDVTHGKGQAAGRKLQAATRWVGRCLPLKKICDPTLEGVAALPI